MRKTKALSLQWGEDKPDKTLIRLRINRITNKADMAASIAEMQALGYAIDDIDSGEVVGVKYYGAIHQQVAIDEFLRPELDSYCCWSRVCEEE